MRVAFAVFLLCIVYVASYPSFREAATNNDESDDDLELELRSILKHLSDENNNEEQIVRSVETDESNEERELDDDLFSKRQGGHSIVDKTSKCEIQCIHSQRHPKIGRGKSVKDAAKACRRLCPNPNKKGPGNKKVVQRTGKGKYIGLRQFDDDDSSEEQQNQRREFYDYLMEQFQQNNNE
ncbi:unnamed protein product [Rotaria sordida]|uniref:Uncharacterized protein n=1 Tax=Rotaria sordida TaxID=392033 RepID=A0A816AIH6_9BILA|nr:unnamed protein product [Rotaria sordida]CAF1343520.1 unnamed protein product [Rotaria sordida]CAF1453796.1 unnamed protein product [Rotaria sordida]CAF1598074.1 unnamed protein product [Rotaria sordida]CAF3710458.1 unnamed protein product [Rotaria sordida]